MTESLNLHLLSSGSLLGLAYMFIIAAALGGDAFSVALGVGAGKRYEGQTFRLSFHFGLFQFLMPLVGWLIGQAAVEWVQQWDHWIASGILAAVAIHALYEAFFPEESECDQDLTRGWCLISLSIATSIDALAVGLVFGVLEITPWLPSLIIGVIAGAMTFTGLWLGRCLRNACGRTIEIAGGMLLLLIAFQFTGI
jgi:putative Mn2+ efflux pump MntP